MPEIPQNKTENRKRGLPKEAEPYMFKPGVSGNPGGRPRKKPITDALRAKLAELIPNDKTGRTFEQAMAEGLLLMALGGGQKKLDAIREILDRVEGKASQPMEHTGEGGGPIVFDTPGSREEVERRLAELLNRTAPKKAKRGK